MEGGEPASIWDLIVAMDLILIFYSIYYPLYLNLKRVWQRQIIYMIIVLSLEFLQGLVRYYMEPKSLMLLWNEYSKNKYSFTGFCYYSIFILASI